jgi:putative transposase
MPNNYHLLLQTPNANLGRIIRHINGVYTQRFNKLQKIDGPLFRGRYKAILVEEDEYLLELSKYIHKNPIQTKNPKNRLVNNLKDYQWSSYQSYLNIGKTPKWLNKEKTLSCFKNDKYPIKKYQLFVETGFNKEIEEFFNKKNQEVIMGKREFKEKILTQKLINQTIKQNQIRKEINNKITEEEIIHAVAKTFGVGIDSIVDKNIGQKKNNLPRSLAIFLCQKYKDLLLCELAKIFNFKSSKSTSNSLNRIKKKINSADEELLGYLNKIEGCLVGG